ncbi:glycerol-3-phosphate dehydrogenase [Actibacterium mucosum KCTC 23349]|uniref:Glycerol-3-phosphate dehydrogenase [NAD(P)+] n=1 Tax=Actibacterium mucosum KCTC 23349 TaxID=1454373 RepID=A0A037ZNS8_9RHOB|nr:glycerol-3-phosphate dehydrogenase [Actibacterium mucosum KCTC 23349]
MAVIGAGAFGGALACALARGGRMVSLHGRDVEAIAATRNVPRLPGITLPDAVEVAPLEAVQADTVLWAVPTQALTFATKDAPGSVRNARHVACCKGIEIATGRGPTSMLSEAFSGETVSVLTGPSFAVDIAAGLPTALTLACADRTAGQTLQAELSTDTLRLYLTDDVTGAELGGALKNVIAIAAGIAMGAGLGPSARAAVVTRGFAEITRMATHRGARPETLTGLSGLGDLVLTCTSDQSRNYRFGLALGRGETFDHSITVEGAATALALTKIAKDTGTDMPITLMIAAILAGDCSIQQAMQALLARPLKEE